MNKYFKLAIGFIISGVSCWFAFRGFAFSDLINALKYISWYWFIPCVLLYPFLFWIRTFRWNMFLSPLVTVKQKDLMPVLVLGFFFNSVWPARVGELARAFVVSRITGIGISSSIGTVAAERFSDLFAVLCVMGLAVRCLPLDQLPFFRIASVFAAIGLFITVFLFFFGKERSSNLRFFQGISKIVRFLRQLTEGFKALKSFRKMSVIVFASGVVWLGEMTIIVLLSQAFHLNLNYIQASALIVGLVVGVMIPAAPGYIGTFEFFGKQTLVLLGFDGGQALSFILTLHFFQLIMIVAMGIPSLFIVGASKDLLRFSLKKNEP